MRAAAVLSALLGVGAVWEGEEVANSQGLAMTREYLAGKYRVEMPEVLGKSKCGDGRRCVALVSMLGLYSYEPPSDSLLNCTRANPDVVSKYCAYYFGTLSNFIHHKVNLNQHRRDSNYTFDLVLIHDETVPELAVQQIRKLGARTMEIPVSAKRLACRGFVKKNPTSRIYMEMCDDHDFNLQRFPQDALRMFLMSMKPIALGMTEYDRVMFTDIDSFLEGHHGMVKSLDYTYDNDNVGLLINMDRFSPVNAGNWIAKPSLEVVDIWLNDIKKGFNSELGWGSHGHIDKIWQRDFIRNPEAHSRLYGRDGKNDPVWEDIKGSWNFLGAQMDQGLLFHIFGLKQKNLHFMNTMDYTIPNSEGITNATWIRTTGFRHYASHPKPWSRDVCIHKHHKFQPADYLKIIQPIARDVRGMAYYYKDQNEILNACARYLHNLVERCRVQAVKMEEKDWFERLPGTK
uniref:Uncharacterized protein n=1 Tax=Lotharella globosa TaxID=91324 RepID=A0A7S4DZ17_9EUKA|mmetsp:Transcript_5135/g.10005  ORF Transcript_5135/g.10005 Transcript_5135/m.10005 type:complete len:459 (+) Transcript_5135:61-1437(+)|eukprot:CAMPEP_0167795032 /NCGR_PEP_ID=MMETSP0111_2-20121227/14199_1 /TAXON_ID=91324 /ORGANISM="Lotharella globosa, Strain CCCM811" /LENGTH=458 /DNA_ID=CAMNT_0007688633 /DNA_START=60 /DNA_END=1436 /DNA_ORIENTATION=-